MFDSKKYKHFALIPIPREKFTLVIPGTGIALDCFKEQKGGQKKQSFIFEICDYPFVIEGTAIIGDGGTIEIKIDPNEADVVQLKKFEEILNAINEKKTIEVYNDHWKRVHRGEGLEYTNYSRSDEWLHVSNLAFIQIATSTRIPAPKDLILTEGDLATIYRIKKIIEEGEYSGKINQLAFLLTSDVLTKLVALQRLKGDLDGIKLTLEKTFETLLGIEITLGAVIYEIPDMMFRDSLDEIEKFISEIGSDVNVEVILVPKSSKPLRAIYPKWKKKLTKPSCFGL